MSNTTTKNKIEHITAFVQNAIEMLLSEEEGNEVAVTYIASVKNSDDSATASISSFGDDVLIKFGLIAYMRANDDFYKAVKTSLECYEKTRPKDHTDDSKTTPDHGAARNIR